MNATDNKATDNKTAKTQAKPGLEPDRSVTNRVIYRNARLIDPATELDIIGDLMTEGPVIRDWGSALCTDSQPDEAEIIDCTGLVLAPGLVDFRSWLCEPGPEHKETIATGSRAAAAGGITSLCCSPATNPPIDSVALIGFVERRGREVGLTRIHPYAALTRGLEGLEITEMGLMQQAGAVAFTDGPQMVRNPQVLRHALNYARGIDALIVHHPQDVDLMGDGVMNEGELSTRLGLAGIPAAAEVVALERDLRIVELTGGTYHAANISTAESVAVMRRAKERGLNVTCDTAPPYFALNELAIGDYRTYMRLTPPLRSEQDRQAIVAGLADGVIDVICSDHLPQDQDAKRLPFAQAKPGATGLETLLPLVLELVHNGGLSLPAALAKMTVSPSTILGLTAGRLQRGGKADLVLFDPDQPWVIDGDNLLSKSKNTPFDGRPVQGQVQRTILAGVPTYL